MFDCPLATQTSPTRTLMMTFVVSPESVNVCGLALGFIGLSQILELSFTATMETSGPANLTETCGKYQTDTARDFFIPPRRRWECA